MANDGMTAWQRAGGWPKEEWHAVLVWAVGKHVAAALARSSFALKDRVDERDGASAERLKADDERWDRLYRGVLAGDPTIFDEVHTLWARETGGPP